MSLVARRLYFTVVRSDDGCYAEIFDRNGKDVDLLPHKGGDFFPDKSAARQAAKERIWELEREAEEVKKGGE